MVTNIKSRTFIIIGIFFALIFSNTIDNSGYNQTRLSNDLLNLNKIDHNFNFSMGMHSNSFGSSSYYSIGDEITYNLSDKLIFKGDFNLITSSLSFNQFDNTFTQPKLNFDLGFKYHFNENTNFQLRIIKNSLNPNCNTVAF